MVEKMLARARRRHRIRTHITGTADRPRLNVHISNKHLTAQIIDDTTGATLVYVSTAKPQSKAPQGSLTQRAEWVGEQIATTAKAKNITRVVLDRGGRLYHGRLHALAEAARQKGLEL